MSMDQHDLPARSARKCPRLPIDGIAKRLDRPLHSLTRRRPDIRSVIENPRDRDPRHSGGFGNIVDCGIALRHARKLAIVCCVRNR